MLMIRLQRVGRTNDPSFRVVVADSRRSAKSGRYVELIGSYNPRTDAVAIKADRAKHWLSKGAQASGTVHNLLISNRVIEGKKVNVLPKKTVPKKEEEVKMKAAAPVTEAAAPAAEAAPEAAPETPAA